MTLRGLLPVADSRLNWDSFPEDRRKRALRAGPRGPSQLLGCGAGKEGRGGNQGAMGTLSLDKWNADVTINKCHPPFGRPG